MTDINTNKEGLLKVNRQQALKLVQSCKDDDTKKGVLLIGVPGTGKTTVMEKVFNKVPDTFALSKLAKKNDGDITESIKLSAVELKNISKNPSMNYYTTTGILIDDLGQEPQINIYGNLNDPLHEIILYAYKSKYRFWGTSNLDLNGLTQRYGKRAVDRIKEMCYIVILSDTNLRDNIKEDNNKIKDILS